MLLLYSYFFLNNIFLKEVNFYEEYMQTQNIDENPSNIFIKIEFSGEFLYRNPLWTIKISPFFTAIFFHVKHRVVVMWQRDDIVSDSLNLMPSILRFVFLVEPHFS